MPRFAEAATPGNDPRLLVVVLRGGMDGINTVVPFGDPHYVSMRGDIAIPRPPARSSSTASSGCTRPCRTSAGCYKAGEAAVVHATCVPLRNRSHFDAQDNLENGLPGLASNATGWLNRLLTALPAGAPISSNGAIQIGDAPLILRGPAPVLGWSPTWFTHVANPTLYLIRTLYRERDPELLSVLDLGLQGRPARRGERRRRRRSSAALRKGFRGAGAAARPPRTGRASRCSRSAAGTRMPTRAAPPGDWPDVLGELDTGIEDFKTAVGLGLGPDGHAAWSRSSGAPCASTATTGTDHGVGTVALLAGGAVNGKRVLRRLAGPRAGEALRGQRSAPDDGPPLGLQGRAAAIISACPPALLNSTIFPASATIPTMIDLVKTGTAAMSAERTLASYASLRAETAIARYRRGERVSRAGM